MENASKALLIAGGVMLTMLVVSLLAYAWNIFSDYQANQLRLQEIDEITKFNLQFTNYERDDVLGYELLSLVNNVIDYNQRESTAGTESGSSIDEDVKVAGNKAQYTPITVNIDMVDKNLIDEKFTRTVNVPKPNGDLYGDGTCQLFTKTTYTQSKTINTFQAKILNVITDIESVTKNQQFGGKTGIQNLVNNIGSIYEGKIIDYNNGPVDKSWYDKNYILDRYKTLTGHYYDNVKVLRKKDNVENVIKYYEYTQFKKAVFKCTGIKYNQQTGRVSELNFEFTGVVK